MIALTIFLGFLALGLLIGSLVRFITDYEGGVLFIFGIITGIAWLVLFLSISNIQFSNETLTGYVYSKDSKWGVNRYHIRFSENAGEDVQPSFCANDGEKADKIDAIVGTGKKVTIKIPSVGWYFNNDIWHCASDAVLVGGVKQ